MILITAMPRSSSVGRYVSELCALFSDHNPRIFHFREESPAQYDAEVARGAGSVVSNVLFYSRLRVQRKRYAHESHVAWEGYGPVFGKETRILTVNHTLPPATSWTQQYPMATRMAVQIAHRGCKEAVRIGTRVVTPAESVKNELIAEYGADSSRITVIHHLVDQLIWFPEDRELARRRLGIGREGLVLASVGNDDIRKDTSTLLRIVREIRRSQSEAMLLKVGQSVICESAMSSDPNIRMFPHPTDEVLRDIYNSADVLLQPSLKEGFCRPVLEAAACGTPSVTSDLPVFREILGGFWRGAQVGEAQRFAATIAEISEGATFGRRADLVRYVTQRFTPSRVKESYAHLYQEVGIG